MREFLEQLKLGDYNILYSSNGEIKQIDFINCNLVIKPDAIQYDDLHLTKQQLDLIIKILEEI